jgi:hypothetical protein
MNIPYLTDHMNSAMAVYRRRRQLQEEALTDAGLMARYEQLLFTHLHVLSRCAPLSITPSREPDHFVDLASRLLSPSETVWQEGYEMAFSRLEEQPPARRASFQALVFFPPPKDDERLLALYRRQNTLRPLLFDLWREQSRAVPPGLISVAELRERDAELQTAALRYAASRPEIGIELFSAYYRNLQAGAAPPPESGSLMATALWGGLLRGERDLAKPLLRCIESETDGQEMYYLLRLAALMALPDAIAIFRHYGKEHPEAAAELLALHGSEPALEALKELGIYDELPQGILDAWQLVSGQQLVPGPRLRLVTPERQDAAEPGTIGNWCLKHTGLEAGQRLLMGEVFTTDRLIRLCRDRAGRFSRDLLDLLSFTIASPLGVTASTLQVHRQKTIEEKVRGTARTEDVHVPA